MLTNIYSSRRVDCIELVKHKLNKEKGKMETTWTPFYAYALLKPDQSIANLNLVEYKKTLLSRIANLQSFREFEYVESIRFPGSNTSKSYHIYNLKELESEEPLAYLVSQAVYYVQSQMIMELLRK